MSPHFELEWIGGRILCYRLTDSGRETVDAYIDTNQLILQAWDKNEAVLMLHDIAHPAVNLTPYFRARLEEVPPLIAETGVHGRSAMLIGKGVLQMILVLYNRVFAKKASSFEQRFFTERESALAWLREKA
jgi:hypothetical protein